MDFDDTSQGSSGSRNTLNETDPFGSETDSQASQSNEQNGDPLSESEKQKIQFAGALKLKQNNGAVPKFPITDISLTKIENCYIDKCTKMIAMLNSLVCICHSIQHRSIKRLFAHLRSICHWFPVYTCYNCLITFSDRSSIMRHNCKCQRSHLENLIKISALRENTDIKNRLYESFKCISCSYVFNFYEDYCDHIDNEHILQEPPYTCICGIIFNNAEDYQGHLHKKCLLNYYCDVCFETFPTQVNHKLLIL